MDLGRGLRSALAKITGAMIVDEKAVKELCKELQRVLISNDVNVKLVFELTKRIESKALDEKLLAGLSVREHVVKVVYDELVALMGERYEPKMSAHRVLLLGLYGSGKTTTSGKLAAYYKQRGLSVALVAADVDRPAAYEQLEQVAKTAGARFCGSDGEKDVRKILQKCLPLCKEDVVIVDSSGRSAFEVELAEQLKAINSVFMPDEKYLVINADIGQVAGRQAKEFHEAVGLSGVIITKMDGSGKGGGALSTVAVSGAKVAFIGVGERQGDIEVFDAKKFVGRLLGFPDFETLMSRIKTAASEAKLQESADEKFTIKVFYEQLKAAKKMGPLGGVFSMMGMADMPADVVKQSEGKMKKYESIIASMTPLEREEALLVKKERGRVERIAKGAGVKVEDVRELLAQFEKMEGMLNQFKRNRGFRKKMEKMMKGANIDLKQFGM